MFTSSSGSPTWGMPPLSESADASLFSGGVGVNVGDSVAVGSRVGVGDGVDIAASSSVKVSVEGGLAVGSGVGVGVGEGVAVGSSVGVGVGGAFGAGVGVGAGVPVGIRVGVGTVTRLALSGTNVGVWVGVETLTSLAAVVGVGVAVGSVCCCPVGSGLSRVGPDVLAPLSPAELGGLPPALSGMAATQPDHRNGPPRTCNR